MADSDNTTTLPFVTRRRKDIKVVTTNIRQGEPQSRKNVAGIEPDPALIVARAWSDAHSRTLALCRRQQQLENRLARKLGYPASPSPDSPSEAAHWERGDLDLGYSKMKGAEGRAVEAAELLLEELARTPAQSVNGVIAKLEVVLLESEVSEAPSGFPWPQLRSVMADLQRITAPARSSLLERRG